MGYGISTPLTATRSFTASAINAPAEWKTAMTCLFVIKGDAETALMGCQVLGFRPLIVAHHLVGLNLRGEAAGFQDVGHRPGDLGDAPKIDGARPARLVLAGVFQQIPQPVLLLAHSHTPPHGLTTDGLYSSSVCVESFLVAGNQIVAYRECWSLETPDQRRSATPKACGYFCVRSAGTPRYGGRARI